MKHSCILFTQEDENGNPVHRSSFIVHRFLRMKKLALFIIQITFSVVTLAQNVFPLENAKWTEVIVKGEHPDERDYYYLSYVLQGDTVIDNIRRSKLYWIPDINKKDSVLMGYIHTVRDTVFYRVNEHESGSVYGVCEEYEADYPLYDFSLKQGDIFDYNCDRSSYQLMVTNIDNIDFGGSNRKRITFGNNDDCWVEGMGSIKGLFYYKERIPTASYLRKYFVCFTQNEEVLYLNPQFSECPIPTFSAINQVQSRPAVNIHPHSLSANTFIVESVFPLKEIKVYSLNGLLLNDYSCSGEMQYIINKSFKSGIYLIKVVLQNGYVKSEKLIIK
jgi:hypothetical protein